MISFRSDRVEILDREGLSPRGRAILEDLERWNRLSGWYRFHTRQVRRHWEALGRPEPFRVLDVGTGMGGLLDTLSQAFPGARLTGLDRGPGYVEEARRRLGPRAEVLEGDATRMPFPAGSFDLVTSTLMLHHLPMEVRRQMVAETARVARSAYFFDLELGVLGVPGWAIAATVLGFGADARSDGMLSVRRASTLRELGELVRPLPVRVRRVFPAAMCTVPA